MPYGMPIIIGELWHLTAPTTLKAAAGSFAAKTGVAKIIMAIGSMFRKTGACMSLAVMETGNER